MVRKQSRPDPKTKGKRNASPIKTKTSTMDLIIIKKRDWQAMKGSVERKRARKCNIPVLPFRRIVEEIMQEFTIGIQTGALKALQKATELYMVQYFADAYFCCLAAKRKTLHIADMQHVRRFRGLPDIVNH